MTAPRRLSFTFQPLTFAAATIFALAMGRYTHAQEVRTWVDSSGQFKIEATYEKLEGEKVFLKMPDGNLKQIPLSMLSKADQDLVREINAPSEPVEVSEPAAPSEPAEVSEPDETEQGSTNTSNATSATESKTPEAQTMAADDAAGATEERTWVDSSGKFKIKATYEKLENDKVFLKLPDGQVKQIPFSMLSDGDKQLVRKLNAPVQPEETPTLAVTAEPSSAEPISPLPTKPAAPADTSPSPGSLSKEDLGPPKPVIHIGQNIGDLNIRTIKPPRADGGARANPKYLLPVEQSEVALLPREFQGAGLLLLDEPNNPRKAIAALDFLKVKWPKNRQPVLIKLLVNCASSDHKFNRESALEILANKDPDQCFPYIFARVDDTSFTIRSKAYEKLRQIGDRRAIAPLARRFASDDVDRISSLLRSFGAASEPSVLPFLSHEDPDIRLRACNLIGKIGTAKSLPDLQQMAAREETMVLKAQTRSSINKIRRRIGDSPQ